MVQRADLDRHQEVLFQTRNDASGIALTQYLTHLRDRGITRLLTMTDYGDIRAQQARIAAYQEVLDAQKKVNQTPRRGSA